MVASSSNAYIMRRPEISVGVSVVDKDGKEPVEGFRSSKAAEKAVHETVVSRALLQGMDKCVGSLWLSFCLLKVFFGILTLMDDI